MNPVNDFAFHAGSIMGLLSRQDVTAELVQGGADSKDLEEIKKRLMKVAEIFYKDKYKKGEPNEKHQ